MNTLPLAGFEADHQGFGVFTALGSVLGGVQHRGDARGNGSPGRLAR